jgi:hypothetical protein
LRPISPISGLGTTQAKKSLAPDVVNDLSVRGFKRSYYHRTVGKLKELWSISPEIYSNYLDLFKAIFDGLGLKPKKLQDGATVKLQDGTPAPSVLLTLILPPAAKLIVMDIEVLKARVAHLTQNYVVALGECDLRGLPQFYPTLAAMPPK